MTLRDISETFFGFLRKKIIGLFLVFFLVFVTLIGYLNVFKINLNNEEDTIISIFNQNKLDELKEMVTNKMINAMALSVPIEVDSGFGKAWFEAH